MTPKNICVAVCIGSLLISSQACRNYAHRTSAACFQETNLFVGGQDSIDTYRIPALVCTRLGTVLAFSEARRNSDQDGSPTDIVLKRSLNNAGRWNPLQSEGPVAAVRKRERDLIWQPMQTLIASKSGEAYMNPVAVADQADRTIFLLVNVFSKPDQDIPQHVWMMKSTDEGAHWSTPNDIGASTGLEPLGPGHGIQMDDGTLVVPTYDGIIYSKDHGRSWKAGGKAPIAPDETQVVELADGSLMLNRRSGGKRATVVSRDGGLTWDQPWNDSRLTEPKLFGGCQASLVRYSRKKDGASRDRLLFSDPADLNFRFNMTVRISYDEGKTWPVAKLIKRGTGAYSDLTVFPDGSVGLLYETGNTYGGIVEYYSAISFARFNLEWLSDGKDHEVKN